MTVSILSLAARGGDEVAVTFEIRQDEHVQKETFLISAASVVDWRLSVGECTQAHYDTVSHGSQVYCAMKRGLYLLGYGSCSARALCGKLIAKSVARDVARQAVEELSRAGYLDERADAMREAERCVSKKWGRRRITEALYAKGFPKETIREALDRLEDDGVDFIEVCADRIRQRTEMVPPNREDRQKLIASLVRYGFSTSEIREAFLLLNE